MRFVEQTADQSGLTTYLFVPGNRPERFAKALASGADRIIIDLEDAVAPADKAAARTAVAAWMGGAGEDRHKVLIRINDCASAWYEDDMAMVGAANAPCVVLPKCESAGQVAAVLGRLPQRASVLPLIETARGMVALNEIAAAPGVARLAFGSLDYVADLDLSSDSLALDFAAAQIAIASRAAGLASPLAGVTPALDAGQVSADMAHARSLGFGGKMCIHPMQVAAVRTALAPSGAELAWAQRVLQAWNLSAGGAIQLDGKMVDRPVVLKAERITAQAASARPEAAK
jgi:citrate lyase subunit beta / citryl-CoA lyase